MADPAHVVSLRPGLSRLNPEDEAEVVSRALEQLQFTDAERERMQARAKTLASQARARAARGGLVDRFLQQYGLSDEEGVALMRLCEALIRTPDIRTSRLLVRDKIGDARWGRHVGESDSAIVNIGTRGLQLTRAWIEATGGQTADNLAARLGDRVMNQAVRQVIEMMGDHFVMGATIEDAQTRARKLAREHGEVSYSYDMLGEAAHTAADAARYFAAYANAIDALSLDTPGQTTRTADGISVKLSALHPRYELSQAQRCVTELAERVITLCRQAQRGGIGLSLDAEEVERLEMSLDIVERILAEPGLADWDGLGVVVQAYQRRAPAVIDAVAQMARRANRRVNVRLVKGAYWDREVKRAQVLGLPDYPVFTRKVNTDVSYLACARQLLETDEHIYPRFATHNAHTVAAIAEMAGPDQPYEFQRLHGMGEALHRTVSETSNRRCRVYAPVGAHRDLLPYLVRRLLENGANSSFVNQLMNPDVAIDDIVRDPVAEAAANDPIANPKIPAPRDHLRGERLAALGYDLGDVATARTVLQMTAEDATAPLPDIVPDEAVETASASDWPATPAPERADILRRAADRMDAEPDEFLSLCIHEAKKTLPDAVAELREAVDFLRYYAEQATDERMDGREPLGIVCAISPWNFPLAIFIGQVAAALAAGNTVVAKPAEQTPLIAALAVRLLHASGVPETALQLVIGDGAVGAALVENSSVSGVVFTGSTATARRIASSLADTHRATIPLIAETGGINAMIIDSTALLEQAVSDVVASAFQSAGQRCSACRIVCVQEEVADAFETMLAGSMAELVVGNAARLSTDVGPIIDAPARSALQDYVDHARARFRVIAQSPAPDGEFIAPIALAVDRVSDVTREVFGPVLHVVRFAADAVDVTIDAINDLDFGLTMGLHTRIDDRAERVAARAEVGNLYINRNQIGAVVGVQPFGGDRLSGTGPKAGGPLYLPRLSRRAGEVFVQSAPGKLGDAAPCRSAPSAANQPDIADRLERAAVATGAQDLAQAALWSRAHPGVEVELPGPTGERNTWRLEPRGVVLIDGLAPTADVRQAAITALAAGNRVVVLGGTLDSLPGELSLPDGWLICDAAESLRAWLEHSGDAVVCDGARRGAVADYLARETGPIRPLLSAHDAPHRYCVERVVTTDTTAAGGNASLLAL